MDPFSVVVGAVSLVDVSVRVIKCLHNFKESVAGTKDEIQALELEINSIRSISESIQHSFKHEVNGDSGKPATDPSEADTLWKNIGATIWNCQKLVCDLEDIMLHILGDKDRDDLKNRNDRRYSATFESLKIQLRKVPKGSRIGQIQNDLKGYKDTLSLFLTLIGVVYHKESKSANGDLAGIITGLSTRVSSLKSDLGSPRKVDLRDSVDSANAMIDSMSSNKYFDPPHGVSSIYTGRELESDQLKTVLLEDSSTYSQRQKRFVVYGLEGSGKTEFLYKFANDFRHHFLGVFWVDASSEERAEESFSRIAKKGGGEHNKLAGMNWLSNLNGPWLLIIDNADDATLSLETLFPANEKGHILITTRNPAHKIHGTIGPRSFHFTGLESSAAKKLLLKAAGAPAPWDSQAQKSASKIAEMLGHLPLALVQAGMAVLNRRCSLQDFEPYFKRTRQRVIHARSISPKASRFKVNHSDTDVNVFATYELLYRGLVEKNTPESAHAIELLNMFAFFHRENIREDILFKAVKNPLLEQQAREKMPIPNNKASLSSEYLRRRLTELSVYLFRITRGPPVLPHVLRGVQDLDDLHEDQIRAALSELSAHSLIIYNETNRSYYIHPLVHTWIRERPEMKTSEQAVWCQAAATTLARSIVLPIGGLGNSEEDADFRRDILGHVRHVLKCQATIQAQLAKNQRSRHWFWPVPTEKFDDRQAGQIARFSMVFAECGHVQDAERLQRRAKEFFCELLGVGHPVSRLLQLGLSRTYWVLGRSAEAARLQETVLEVCRKSMGPKAHETLSMQDMLGTSLSQQGKFKEALALHRAALGGMKEVLGDYHPDTLKCTVNLAGVQSKYFEYEKAKTLLEHAFESMSRELGPNHPDTLIAEENFAMACLDLGGCLVENAHKYMLDVLAKRKKKLGREHPYTLLAMCHLARVKAARGDFGDAEQLMNDGLATAERNLGPTHIGTLYGKSHLGRMLLLRCRHQDAEDVLVDTIRKHESMAAARNGEHPDRLIAMRLLIDCYQEQGKISEAISVSRDAMAGLRMIGGHDHPLMRKLDQRLIELQALQQLGPGTQRTVEVGRMHDLSPNPEAAGVTSLGPEHHDHTTVPNLGSGLVSRPGGDLNEACDANRTDE